MRKFFLSLVCGLILLSLFFLPTASAQASSFRKAKLSPVNNSGVTGTVYLVDLPHDGGTVINLITFGLTPGSDEVSLYYDNHTCALEPYSEDDVIGGTYHADKIGIGHTFGIADDGLDDINSVSVRKAGDFSLLACADIHP